MKLVVISDTHNRHAEIVVPDGDVLIHCGDATGRGTIAEMAAFNAWMGSLPHATKIYVPGNHDALPETNEMLAREIMSNVEMLIGQSIIVQGLKFYGFPWTPTFFDWNFMLDRGAPMKERTDAIPSDTNILISHGPAYGILDAIKGRSEYLGCRDLRDRILEVKPQIHVCGHIHSAHGLHVAHGTLHINAAQLNEQYKVGYKPVIVNI